MEAIFSPMPYNLVTNYTFMNFSKTFKSNVEWENSTKTRSNILIVDSKKSISVQEIKEFSK